MSHIDEMLKFNKRFVAERQYEAYPSTKRPAKGIAVLSCMDARLTEILPAALDFHNGDVHIIKNAGALISHPFGSVMRSLLLAVYELGVRDIIVVGHYDCGVQGMDAKRLTERMTARGVAPDTLDFMRYCGVDIEGWLGGFESAEGAVRQTVGIIKGHPLIPADVGVRGFLMDPETGRLDGVV